MQKQKGFTLIELIIVIVVLGILAVTAAPQFINFSTDARESTLNGLRGSMNGAADLVYGKSALEGIEGAEEDSTEDGIDVVYGYPEASLTGIIAALNIDQDDWDIVAQAASATDDGILFISPTGVNENDAGDDVPEDADDFESCFIQYTNAEEGERPAITVTETGC